MTVKIYGLVGSPPYGAVLMCAKVLGLKTEFIPVNLLAREHLKSDLLEKNPQHTVPFIDDNGFYLADSHAINGYLVDTYGTKFDYLYPKNDVKRRAIINHRLHLDSSIVAARGFLLTRPLVLSNIKPTEFTLNLFREGFEDLNRQLKTDNTNYIAGDQLSIADFSITASVTNWGYFLQGWENDFPYINNYIERMKNKDWFTANNDGLEAFRNLFDQLNK